MCLISEVVMQKKFNSSALSEILPLYTAVLTGDDARVWRLLKSGYQPINESYPVTGKTALHILAETDKTALLEKMIAQGGSVQQQDCRGAQPLHHAALWGHIKTARQLLESGADPNATANRGNTPLHDAALYGTIEMVQFLAEHGADVRLQDAKGKTASDLAKNIGRADVVQWLDSYVTRQDSDRAKNDANPRAKGLKFEI
jgi:ankyrin repeat protein